MLADTAERCDARNNISDKRPQQPPSVPVACAPVAVAQAPHLGGAPAANKLKRKRTSSVESSGAQPAAESKKLKLIRPGSTVTGQAISDGAMPEPCPTTKPPPTPISSIASKQAKSRRTSHQDLTKLQPNAMSEAFGMAHSIEHHFNLEVLLKHRELRLIEQEMAKCQVALEQLRRCSIIPYPGAVKADLDLPSTSANAIALGKPDAQPHADPRPEYAPAWGVTDGPYTRHYAKWLIKDPMFDGNEISNGTCVVDALSTALGDKKPARGATAANTSRSRVRAATNAAIILPQPQPIADPAPGPPMTRGKSGPLIIKRMSDGQNVKLICNKCHRSDFSSVQGFLNHCRIAHKLDYKSHEAAAKDCGQLLDANEAALLAKAEAAPPVAIPLPTARSAPATCAVKPTTNTGPHWLNQNQISMQTWSHYHTVIEDATRAVVKLPAASTSMTDAAKSFDAGPLQECKSAPFLSALFAKKGHGGDLNGMVGKAQEKIDLGPEESEEVEFSSVSTSPARRAAKKKDSQTEIDQGSRISHRQPFQRSSRPPTPISFNTQVSCPEMSGMSTEPGVSPHGGDSNPGLVSDREDDVVSEAEELAAPIVTPTAAIELQCGDEMDLDIQVDDSHDEHGVLIRRRNIELPARDE